MLNKVFTIGNLTKDPELRYTPQGTAVCNIRFAINRKYKSGEEMKEEVTYLTAVAWGKTAENCNTYIKKGSKVFIEGRLQVRSWDNTEGKKQYATEIVVENIQFLDGKKDNKPAETETWLEEEGK